MRKLARVTKFLIFLPLMVQFQSVGGQDFGRVPLKECWRIEGEGINGVKPASDNVIGNVFGLFLSNSEGFIEAVEKNSGEKIWQTEIGGEIIPQIISDSQRIFVISKNLMPPNFETGAFQDFTVRSLSLSTGVTNWQKSFPSSNGENIFLLNDANRLIVMTDKGRLLLLNKEDGEIIRERQYNFNISTLPFLFENNVYVGTGEKKIVVISISDGRVLSRINTGGIPKLISTSAKTALFVADTNGDVYSIDIGSSWVNWKTRVGAEATNIAKVSKGLLVSSLDNYVYLLSEKNGKRIWKRRLSGRSFGTPLIKENVAVFSTFGGRDAVFIELNKGKAINHLSIQDENYFINNPVGIGDLVFFPTFKGVIAYAAGSQCK